MIKAARHTGSCSAFPVKNLSPNTTIPDSYHTVSSLLLWLLIADPCNPFLQRIRKGFSLRSTNAKCRCQCVVVRLANTLDFILLDMALFRHNNALLPLVRPWLNLCGLILASALLRLRP